MLNGKKGKVFAVLVLGILTTAILFGCSPTLEDRAKEYLTKYDDTFTYVDKKESGGTNVYTFSSQKYPDKAVYVRYESMFDQNGMSPFYDNYMGIRYEEEGLAKGRELAEKIFPGEDYELCRSFGGYYQYYDKDSSYDYFYSGEGEYFGIILHKTPSEDQLNADAEKIKEVLKGEDEKLANATAALQIKVLYYSGTDRKLNGNDIKTFADLSDYEAVLDVNYVKTKGECDVVEMGMAK